MKSILIIAACLLLVTPGVAASEAPSAAAPCPPVLSIGVLPYALCMAVYSVNVANNAVITACEVIFGPGNC